MNNPLKFDIRAAQRLMCVMVAALLLVAGLPMFLPGYADAAQVTNRFIRMSDSAPSGTSITTGVGSGTNVTYRVSFDATVAAGSMVIDFCTETPLMNAVCTRPTGMDTTPCAFAAVTGEVSTGWTCTSTTNGQILFQWDGLTGAAIAAGTQTFDITGITNPSTTGSFYGRITTYANTSQGTYASPASAGNFVDFGGIALSTVTVITITARVQEQLTFCVSKANPTSWVTTNDCSDTVVASNPPAVVLGHNQNGILILDSSVVDTDTIHSQLSTNATNGAVVRMRNSNLSCGGLSADNGTSCPIPAHNGGSGAGASALVAGTASFGLFVGASSLGTNGVGTLTPAAAYHNASHTTVPSDVWFGMDNTTANNNVTSTFGSTLCTTSGPIYRVNTAYTFAAAAALTTPAGIYTANLSMIATGTF
jgi:hypothetical protein